MLRTIVGRDLLMIAGSEEAYFLFQELFGYARTRSFGCEDNLGNSSRWPTLRHPEACIGIRVRAFSLANLHARTRLLATPRALGYGCRATRFVFLDYAVKDFLSMHRDRLRCLNSDANLVTLNVEYRNGNFVTDSKRLADPASQDQHVGASINKDRLQHDR
jgi:hypothetical protein